MNKTITLKDVYDVVNRLEDKMDNRLKELEGRVDKNEGFRNKALGVVGVVAAFSSLLASYVWDRIIGR